MPSFNKNKELNYLGRNLEEWESSMLMEGKTSTMITWIDRKLRVVFKNIIDGNCTMEAVDIKMGDIPDEKFTYPEEYSEFSYESPF